MKLSMKMINPDSVIPPETHCAHITFITFSTLSWHLSLRDFVMAADVRLVVMDLQAPTT